MPFVDPTEQVEMVKFVLNAASAGWGTTIDKAIYNTAAINKALKLAGYEVVRAIAANPQSGHFGELATLLPIVVDPSLGGMKLPGYTGEIGLPIIVPFAGAPPRTGVEARPDEIDAYIDDVLGLYNLGVPHDQADENLMPSPISCRFSLEYDLFKFTGCSCQLPLIQPTDDMALNKIPVELSPTQVKRAIPLLVKEGDNLAQIAGLYGAEGSRDLVSIQEGAYRVAPVRHPRELMAERRAA